MTVDDRERAALIALLKRAVTGWQRVTIEVLESGSALDILDEAVSQRDTLFPQPNAVDALIADASLDLRRWQATGIGVHTIFDESYPAQLRDIREMPPVLFTRGTLTDDTLSIAVVGTRQASDRGLRLAREVAEWLSHRGITVVSGLAAGIDTAAHKATLASSGRTVAVIGTGIMRHYPAENRQLQEHLADRGLVLSQFWPDAPPRREHFLMRNAIMSGYAAATVVVEAGERSGARSQASLALKHGRQVVLFADLLAQPWATSLAQRPGVHVVGASADVTSVIDAVLSLRRAELTPREDLPDLSFA